MIIRARRRALVAVLLVPLAALAGCSSGRAEPSEPPAEPGRTAAPFEVAGMAPAEAPDCFPEGAHAFTADVEGQPLTVVVAGTGSDGVLLAPMSGLDHCSWAAEAKRLVEAGHVVASFTWVTDGSVSMTRGIEVLRAAGAEDVVLMGASKGGAYAAAMADEVEPAPAGVIALGPPEEFEVDARSASSTYTGPLLVVATTDDANVPVDRSRAVARADDPGTFVELPGSEHGVELFLGPRADEVRGLVDGLLAEAFNG